MMGVANAPKRQMVLDSRIVRLGKNVGYGWEGRAMLLRGIVQAAELAENPPGSDQIEMILRVQGVGPGQPRRFVVPMAMLLDDPEIEPEAVAGHGFAAEVEEDGGRWVATSVSFAGRRVLRDEG